MNKSLVTFLLIALFSSQTFAKGGGGGFEIGAHAGIVTVNQSDMDTLKTRANTRENGISTGDLGNAWEFGATFGYRFSGTIYQMLLRPTFFMQSEEGKNNAGDAFEYSVNGFTIMPMFRFFPLESDILKLFFHVGIGYGSGSGTIKEDDFTVDFSGGDLGYLVGLGIEVCFTDFHCVSLEGNLRQLSYERVIADSVSGTPSATSPTGVSQADKGQELEMDGRDLSITMSGFQALIGYVMHF